MPEYLEYGVSYNGDNGISSLVLKSMSRWPNTEYINIWVVTGIVGGTVIGNGVAGYATYPGASSSVDGIVLRYDLLSWAITHEIGHYFGLRHTFEVTEGSESCPSNFDCLLLGDFVCDTDPHFLLSGCPTGTNTCTGNSLIPIVYNIMNYTSCPDRFTAGQKERVLFILENFRGTLITSYGAIAVGEEIVEDVEAPIPASCIPLGISIEDNTFNVGIHSIQLADLNVSSGGYKEDGAFYIDYTQESCLQQRSVANLIGDQLYTINP